MKKWIVAVAAVAVMVVSAAFVYAQEAQPAPPAGPMMNVDQMLEFHKQMLDQAVKNGSITAEQAKFMNEHMTQMAPMMQQMMTGMGSGMMGGNAVNCPGLAASGNNQ
ncbi:hypothetical protein TcarDRAFT_1431 [Thermosinus carboxydivorans Nor1]|uniref:DUF2680 domain-containing protein n=1 Tax=Thermosinus carboxydivorans Nor1 TaxID=401526 RepID=A1HR97_9FIRM|nr:DUF2680 domain-containing protein [Thermosinus carboxydivorans]EAX47413.1 hypothetical protein TcarDRAFT_1431 [Thermosinus carboxydivorans Nor1]